MVEYTMNNGKVDHGLNNVNIIIMNPTIQNRQ